MKIIAERLCRPAIIFSMAGYLWNVGHGRNAHGEQASRLVQLPGHDCLVLLDVHVCHRDRQIVEYWQVGALLDHLDDL